jgi:hypothetical protein
MDESKPSFPSKQVSLHRASGLCRHDAARSPVARVKAATTRVHSYLPPCVLLPALKLHARWAVIAAIFFLLETHDMSNRALSFEGTRTGVAPEGWTATRTGSGDPKWTVESDDTAPSKSNVLQQSGNATYPLLLKNDTDIKDGFVEVKFKAVAGSQDRAAGIVWRAKDANNYYVTRANALEDNVVLYKTVNGVRSPLDIVGRKGGYGINIAVPANTWHSLRVDFKGSRFSVSFNGRQVFEVEDSTFTGAGKVGLWTKADSLTLFDEVSYGESK